MTTLFLSPERIALLRRLDPEEIVAAASDATRISQMLGSTREQTLKNALVGAHKARVMAAKYFTVEEVSISKIWLNENNYEVPRELR